MSTQKFYLDSYLSDYANQKRSMSSDSNQESKLKSKLDFNELCSLVKNAFQDDMASESVDKAYDTLSRQLGAILGVESHITYYKDKIREYLRINNYVDTWYPPYYLDIVDAVFQENWGLSVLAPWVYNYREEYKTSTSAKIIGEDVYFMVDGVMKLQPQKISASRLSLLKKSLILDQPNMKITDPYNDVYLIDGTRVTIFGDNYTKENRGVIILRKFIMEDLSLEEQASLNTIPDYSIDFFKLVTRLGYNCLIAGGPNTGKSTFYETLQRYEDPTLQGIQIETDPEVDMKALMPNSPIMELVADGDDLRNIIKPILRADPDYIKIGEARDGVALHIMVRAANKGTRRVKGTYHITNCLDICNQISEEIVESVGGSLRQTSVRVARSFQFVFELFRSRKHNNRKILKTIYSLNYDEVTGDIVMNIICKYNILNDCWEWTDYLSDELIEMGYMESVDETLELQRMLKEFKRNSPYLGNSVYKPIIVGG